MRVLIKVGISGKSEKSEKWSFNFVYIYCGFFHFNLISYLYLSFLCKVYSLKITSNGNFYIL